MPEITKNIEKPTEYSISISRKIRGTFYLFETLDVIIPMDLIKNPEKTIKKLNKNSMFHSEIVNYSDSQGKYLRISAEYDIEDEPDYVNELRKITSEITEGEISKFFKEYSFDYGNLIVEVKDGKVDKVFKDLIGFR
jgi:hypothetical protein